MFFTSTGFQTALFLTGVSNSPLRSGTHPVARKELCGASLLGTTLCRTARPRGPTIPGESQPDIPPPGPPFLPWVEYTDNLLVSATIWWPPWGIREKIMNLDMEDVCSFIDTEVILIRQKKCEHMQLMLPGERERERGRGREEEEEERKTRILESSIEQLYIILH